MPKLTKRMVEELTRLAARPDSEIDFSDIPEVTDWSDGVVGKYYRPIKKPLTIRIDADVVAWLKAQGSGYQTRINRILREAMMARARRRR